MEKQILKLPVPGELVHQGGEGIQAQTEGSTPIESTENKKREKKI